MRKYVQTTAAMALFTLSVCTAFAQQPTPSNKKAPTLTTDDVGHDRNPPASTPNSDLQLKTADPGQWARRSPGGLNLSVELPGELQSVELPYPEDMRNFYRRPKAYICSSDEIIVMILYTSSYRSSVTSEELKAIAAGLTYSLKNEPGNSDVRLSTEMSGPSRFLIKGSYKEGDLSLGIEWVFQSKGSDVWVVMTEYPQADNAAPALSRRVMNSIRFE